MTSSALPPTASEPAKCPSCGALASGKFCSECGGSLGGARCGACGVELIDGAKFCHRCGLPVGAAVPTLERQSSGISLPWIVAAIALLALVSLVAGQRFGANRAAQVAAQVAAPDVSVPDAATAQGPRAPDISQLTPAERAIRLYDRLMMYNEAGKRDSVTFFAPMALAAYQMLGDLDLDGHYDVGRIGEITGDASLAAAEADTILRRDPKHLLGLILAAHAARMNGQAGAERTYLQRLVAAEPSESGRQLPEYITHRGDLTAALDEARRTVRR